MIPTADKWFRRSNGTKGTDTTFFEFLLSPLQKITGAFACFYAINNEQAVFYLTDRFNYAARLVS